jgi:hypothetical protein
LVYGTLGGVGVLVVYTYFVYIRLLDITKKQFLKVISVSIVMTVLLSIALYLHFIDQPSNQLFYICGITLLSFLWDPLYFRFVLGKQNLMKNYGFSIKRKSDVEIKLLKELDKKDGARRQ